MAQISRVCPKYQAEVTELTLDQINKDFFFFFLILGFHFGLGGISDGVKCLFILHVDFCLLFFVQVLTNDENLLLLKDKITELLNITE